MRSGSTGVSWKINPEHSGGFTYKKLNEVEDALLWNEAHLREPRINVLQGEGIAEPIVDLTTYAG